MSDTSPRFPWLVLAVGVAAVIVGGVFAGRGLAGEDGLASWWSAAVGIVGGGCAIVYAVLRLGAARR